MRKIRKWICSFFASRRCRFCGYEGNDWPDSGECPNCGEVN